MVDQKQSFLKGEGDSYFRRNADRLKTDGDDIVLRSLRQAGIRYDRILEIGCANGHRVAALATGGRSGAGIDPSAEAITAGKALYPALHLEVGTADSLPFADGAFDLVIFGFCFYLVDPQLHFRTVAEADRVLADHGTLAILDFITPVPYANDYAHLPGLRAHKMEFARYFYAHPAYGLIARTVQTEPGVMPDVDNRIGVDLLAKSMATAFPSNPFRNR